MRFIAIDIGSETHVVAAVDENGKVAVKATPFSEDAEGYAKLRKILGRPGDALCALEATGITGRICSPFWPQRASP